jgi:hypothetical protein
LSGRRVVIVTAARLTLCQTLYLMHLVFRGCCNGTQRKKTLHENPDCPSQMSRDRSLFLFLLLLLLLIPLTQLASLLIPSQREEEEEAEAPVRRQLRSQTFCHLKDMPDGQIKEREKSYMLKNQPLSVHPCTSSCSRKKYINNRLWHVLLATLVITTRERLKIFQEQNFQFLQTGRHFKRALARRKYLPPHVLADCPRQITVGVATRTWKRENYAADDAFCMNGQNYKGDTKYHS